jgi:F-type H+-transporting ATPase subunit a
MGEKIGLEGIPAFIMASLLPVPFYFLEILVGLLQAGVFMILCTVYLMLSTSHDEEDH